MDDEVFFYENFDEKNLPGVNRSLEYFRGATHHVQELMLPSFCFTRRGTLVESEWKKPAIEVVLRTILRYL